MEAFGALCQAPAMAAGGCLTLGRVGPAPQIACSCASRDYTAYPAAPRHAAAVPRGGHGQPPALACCAVLSAAALEVAIGRSGRSGARRRGHGASGCRSKPQAFSAEDQVGVIEQIGFFDPLGIAKGDAWKPLRGVLRTVGFSGPRGAFGFVLPEAQQSSDEFWFRRLREAELKHARVAMLAALGNIIQHVARLPSFEAEGEGIAGSMANEKWNRIAILVFILCGQLERNQFRQLTDRDIGDFGKFGDPLKLGPPTPELRTTELINGRVAMLALASMAAVELSTGRPSVDVLWPLPSQ